MNKIASFVLFSLWIFTLTGQSLSLTDTTIVKSRSSVVVCFLIGDSNNYKIRWCKDSESHVSSREYPLINGELLTIVDTLEKYVVLFQNCGQKNKSVVLLPLKRSQPEMVFENVLEYDILN